MSATAVVERFFQLAAEQRADELADLMSDDAISFDPIDSEPLVGREAHRAMFSGTDALFRSVAFDTSMLAEHGPYVAVRWVASGTLTDGRQSRFGGIDVFEIGAHGRIAAHWAYWDPDDIERLAT